jgi:hypothetical protein
MISYVPLLNRKKLALREEPGEISDIEPERHWSVALSEGQRRFADAALHRLNHMQA